ncbi:hypothetical protein SPBRAN_261 [uncultured Candidatus Thioglobus sp.]|nr:hypothetical protein SPBRAN_261 [uncultured Candidatus Thioglobus sp.]
MKLIKSALLVAFISLSFQSIAGYVNGYTKSNGTYVNGYYRSDSNNTVRDNYSYSGNTNPYTGNTNPYTGNTGSNKYYDSPSSDYYSPYRSKQSSSPWD